MVTVERQKNYLSPNSDFKLDLSKVIENLKGGEAHSFLSIQNELRQTNKILHHKHHPNNYKKGGRL